MNVDASFDVTVDRTAWGDVSLIVRGQDLQIDLDPMEAARVCPQIWTALGRTGPALPAGAVSVVPRNPPGEAQGIDQEGRP